MIAVTICECNGKKEIIYKNLKRDIQQGVNAEKV